MLLNKSSRLIMIGDSITDSNRNYDAQPAGWGSFGDGYVNLVNAFFTGLAPEKKIMVINKGKNGNTIRDLKQRWEEDVLELNPDWVSIMIGVNDVWRHFDGELTQISQVEKEEFEQTYLELVKELVEKKIGVIIMSPFMFEPNKTDKMRVMLNEYADIAKKVAAKVGAIYVDTQVAVDEYLEQLSPYIVSQDRVHPNISGHMILAKAFLKSVDFQW